MAEDLKKQQEEQLHDEQLDEVSGGKDPAVYKDTHKPQGVA